MEKYLVNKEKNQRHRLLLVDEMGTRTSVLVNSQNLTYTGLIDFGEENPSGTSVKDMADHGLVLMFQPLADTYVQPIAVFGSKGPTKEITLAKVIVKAIILLEKNGTKVHGMITDSARPNRRFWTEMGLNANPKMQIQKWTISKIFLSIHLYLIAKYTFSRILHISGKQ